MYRYRKMYADNTAIAARLANEIVAKNRAYNEAQTEVGQPLRTLTGSVIKRSKYGVGKLIGGKLYAHKNYIHDIVPAEVIDAAMDLLDDHFPDFEYNCFRWDPSKKELLLQECPDFNTAREPVVGTCIKITEESAEETQFFNQIFHHKWLWVTDDYTGFDVSESWEWSKEWLSVLTESANGSNQANWLAQLERFGLR